MLTSKYNTSVFILLPEQACSLFLSVYHVIDLYLQGEYVCLEDVLSPVYSASTFSSVTTKDMRNL